MSTYKERLAVASLSVLVTRDIVRSTKRSHFSISRCLKPRKGSLACLTEEPVQCRTHSNGFFWFWNWAYQTVDCVLSLLWTAYKNHRLIDSMWHFNSLVKKQTLSSLKHTSGWQASVLSNRPYPYLGAKMNHTWFHVEVFLWRTFVQHFLPKETVWFCMKLLFFFMEPFETHSSLSVILSDDKI